jgi:hypothetical protein
METGKNMEKIETILPEHEARFPEWVEKWTAIGLCTDRADFEAASAAAKSLYKILDKKEPTVLFAESPKAAILMGLKAELGREPTKEECRAATQYTYGGAMMASWNAYVTFLRDVMGWENEVLTTFALGETLCKTCGWVWWSDTVCVIIDRPEVIKMNDQNVLHCEDGPAIRYTDGWSVYSWNGTRIPADWIENRDNLDPTLALTWENIEQRRCAAEIIGWHIVLDKLDSVVVDEDGDPEIGTLLEVDLPDIGKERFLKVLCGTGRTFALPVPPEMKTALEAQSWSWGIDEKDFFKPEVRT